MLTSRIAGASTVVGARRSPTAPSRWRSSADETSYTFAVAAGGAAAADAGHAAGAGARPPRRSASTATNHFTGACIGLYATGNGKRATVPADFDWFEYTPGPQ